MTLLSHIIQTYDSHFLHSSRISGRKKKRLSKIIGHAINAQIFQQEKCLLKVVNPSKKAIDCFYKTNGNGFDLRIVINARIKRAA